MYLNVYGTVHVEKPCKCFSLPLLMDLLLCGIIQHPVETYGYAVIFSITGYLGINIVLTLVTTFGALPAVTSEYVEEARVTLGIRFTSDKWTVFCC